MKNTLLFLLVATTIILGMICVVQLRKSTGQQTQLASVQSALDEKAQQFAALQDAQEQSELQRHELTAQADQLTAQLHDRQSAGTNPIALPPANPPPLAEGEKPAEEEGGFGKILSKLMQDPDTKQLVRNTQRMMMDQLYAPLIKELGLTQDEAANFKDLLAENAMKASEHTFSMFGGPGSTNRAELLEALSTEQKTFDDQLKVLLGDARYARYKEYQETAGERMQLNAFKLQSGSDYPLNDQQTEQLLTFMKEEKQNVAATTGLPLGAANKDPASSQAMLSDDKVAELFQAQESVGQRVYERARSILSADQLEQFGKFQTNQLQMMRIGMNMARRFVRPDKSEHEERQ